MKVTTQGEDVINHLWDVIAAKGFEKDTYFEMAARDIRALPKLEGTVHVNIALIVKFMANYFFQPAELPRGPAARRSRATTTSCSTRGRRAASARSASTTTRRSSRASICPTCGSSASRSRCSSRLLAKAPPDEAQTQDIDFLLAVGEIFTLVVYAQLVLENAEIYEVDGDLVDQIFDVLVRDFSQFAVQLHGKPSSTAGAGRALPGDDPQARRRRGALRAGVAASTSTRCATPTR